MSIGEKLIKLRKLKGITQSQLATKINYSDKVISKWEREESLPDIQALTTLANFYEVSVDDIIKNAEVNKNMYSKSYKKLKMPIIMFHILLIVVMTFFIARIFGITYFTPNVHIILNWQAIVGIIIAIIIIIMCIIDLFFVYFKVKRIILHFIMFGLICFGALLLFIALIIFGGSFDYVSLNCLYINLLSILSVGYGYLIDIKLFKN